MAARLPVIRQLREGAASKGSIRSVRVPCASPPCRSRSLSRCSQARAPPPPALRRPDLPPSRRPRSLPSRPRPSARRLSRRRRPRHSLRRSELHPDAGPTFAYDATALTAGPHAAQVMGTGSYPGYTVVVPAGWFDVAGHHFVRSTQRPVGPVLGLSVWDVGQVFRDPCHWQGQGFDPGPSVSALVAALVAQPMRNATRPTDVTLAGYKGRYLELSVPADLKSSTWTNFDACDVDADGPTTSRAGWATAWATATSRFPARSTGCGSSTSTGSGWSSTPPTHPTPPRLTGTSCSRSWSRSV